MKRARPEYAFDSLLAGLVDALENARRAAEDRRCSDLQAFASAGTRRVGPVEAGVSVASLRAFQQMRIRDLSIEFECAIRTCRRTSALQLVLARPPWWRRDRFHRVLVEIVDAPQPSGRVSIDGRLFKRFPASAQPASALPTPA